MHHDAKPNAFFIRFLHAYVLQEVGLLQYAVAAQVVLIAMQALKNVTLALVDFLRMLLDYAIPVKMAVILHNFYNMH